MVECLYGLGYFRRREELRMLAYEFHIALYVAAILIGMTCLVYSMVQKRLRRLQNRFSLESY